MFTLILLAILPYWILPWVLLPLPVSPFSLNVGLFVYLAHWAGVGGLIGFALSKQDRGVALGCIVGALLAAFLMC